jgi:hypothetical protein
VRPAVLSALEVRYGHSTHAATVAHVVLIEAGRGPGGRATVRAPRAAGCLELGSIGVGGGWQGTSLVLVRADLPGRRVHSCRWMRRNFMFHVMCVLLLILWIRSTD